MEDISLETEEYLDISQYYLSKMFARYAGINYKDYLQNIRLEHAVKGWKIRISRSWILHLIMDLPTVKRLPICFASGMEC